MWINSVKWKHTRRNHRREADVLQLYHAKIHRAHWKQPFRSAKIHQSYTVDRFIWWKNHQVSRFLHPFPFRSQRNWKKNMDWFCRSEKWFAKKIKSKLSTANSIKNASQWQKNKIWIQRVKATIFLICCKKKITKQPFFKTISMSNLLTRFQAILMNFISVFFFGTGGSELTGATNLMAYYGLEHSYSKFSGKKVKEQLSSFLPNLPGVIDGPGQIVSELSTCAILSTKVE